MRYGWGWIDGEDDDAANKWIQISPLDEAGNLEEEMAVIMCRNFDKVQREHPEWIAEKERIANKICAALRREQMSWLVKARQRVERRICRRIILDALQQGYTIKVYDGEEMFGPFNKVKPILDAMFSVDEEHLLFYKDGKKVGWAFLIYGNACDVLSDHSDNEATRQIVEGASKLADTLS